MYKKVLLRAESTILDVSFKGADSTFTESRVQKKIARKREKRRREIGRDREKGRGREVEG